MGFKLDGYNFRARLAPILLVALPATLGIGVWLPLESDALKLLGSLGMNVAIALLMIQLGRDLGKGKQATLFASWDGKPTTRMLRHRDTTLDPHTKARYHRRCQARLPDPKGPSARAEKGNPAAADQVYESWVRCLLELTRDKKKYPLVFEANVNYGFRRNYWAMKPAGILSSSLGLLSSTANTAFTHSETTRVAEISVISIIFCTLFLTWWLLRITPGWVKLAGDAYAERLLAACETLEPLVQSERQPR